MRLILIPIFLAAIALGIFAFSRTVMFDAPFHLPEARKATDFAKEEIKKEILAPPPLRAEKDAPHAALSRAGVLAWTNAERREYGLAPLSENAMLDQAATLKLHNMFALQYFSHVSPQGLGPDHWAAEAGYEYVTIGENLALGNFKDDQELVQAWMDSPGHRANLLNTRYEGIGVAVGKGTFEGRATWLAVQVFGRLLASCPQPEETLKARIQANENQLASLEVTLAQLRAELARMRPKFGPAYNAKADEYNAYVAQYNALAEETKSLIAHYNSQVSRFNACLQE